MRRVFGAHEVGEILVCRDNFVVDGVGDLLGQAFLIFGGNACGIFFGRQQERIGVDDALTLRGKFLHQESNRHELVFHAGAEDFDGLGQDLRNLVQTRDVVLVVFDGIERHGERQIGEAGMDAVLLVDGHLVFFEVEVGDALLQNANQQVVRELVLIGEAGGRDRLQARKEHLRWSGGVARWRRASSRRACRCSGNRQRRWRARESCADRIRTVRRKEHSGR